MIDKGGKMHYQIVSETIHKGFGIVISMEMAGEMIGTFEAQVRELNEKLEHEDVIFARCDLYSYSDSKIIAESFISGMYEERGNNQNKMEKIT